MHTLLRVTLPLFVAGLVAPVGGLRAQNVSSASATVPRATGGRTDPALVLEPHLWRNFQPTTGTPDSSLTLLVRISAADRQALPGGLRVERAIARTGDRAWTVRFGPEDATLDGDALELVARGGPAWPVGSMVDVLVELRDARGRSWRVSARTQAIRRLD